MDNGGGIGAAIGGLLYLVFVIAFVAGMWKTFAKAGKPGWAAIVPIYNYIVLLEIVEKPIWWIAIFLFLFPVAWIVVMWNLAMKFGKGGGFGIGLICLPFIFIPMLGFSDARYQA